MSKLEVLIDKAAKGDEDAVIEFYKELWEKTELIVPLVPNALVEASGIDPKSKDVFYVAQVDGRSVIPIFSSPSYLQLWAGEEIPFVTKLFRTLLWVIPHDTWLHLNPAQDLGKEFTPWELEQLRDNGLNALEELAEDVMPSEQGDFELETSPGVYPEYERKLRSVFEVYEEIKEGFIVTLTNLDTNTSSVLVGVSQEGLEEKRLEELSAEIVEMARVIIPSNMEISVVPDVNNPSYPYSALFRDAVPFYLRPDVDTSEPSIFNKVLDRYNPKFDNSK